MNFSQGSFVNNDSRHIEWVLKIRAFNTIINDTQDIRYDVLNLLKIDLYWFKNISRNYKIYHQIILYKIRHIRLFLGSVGIKVKVDSVDVAYSTGRQIGQLI